MLWDKLWPQVSSGVPSGVLGRTNLVFPPTWLRLSPPSSASDLAPLVETALGADVPLDVTTSPGLWGGYLRATEARLTCVSSADFEWATDDRHASDLVQAHLLETLSCVGRDYFDIYFLRVRRAMEEYQVAGVLLALEMARQEGHIRFIGIACDGPATATLGLWQFHDAFDLALMPESAYSELAPMARARRAGIVVLTSGPGRTDGSADAIDTETQMVSVISSEQVTRALQQREPVK